MNPQADAAEIRSALALNPDSVVEIRVLMGRNVEAGYFDPANIDAAVEAAARYSGRGQVYRTVNPINPALMARAENRIKQRAETTTADKDIVRRKWLYADFDAERPASVSSTDEEHERAIALAYQVADTMQAEGWAAASLIADSGNGANIYWAIDEPNDAETAALIKAVLEAFSLRFGSAAVKVDTSVYNAARIARVPGTLNVKGDSTASRPHRLARILRQDESAPVTRAQLEALAAMVPRSEHHSTQGTGRLDLQGFINKYNVPVESSVAWGSGEKWVFPACPFNPEHSNRSAVLLQFATGAIAFRCHHNGCNGRGWRELRALYDPDYGAHVSSTNGHDDAWPEPQPLPTALPEVPPFDERLLPERLRQHYVDIADRAQAPLDYPAAAGIVALSSALGRRLGIHPKRHDDWMVVPNLWGLIIGPPGVLKSPMLHEVLRPLNRLEANAREAYEVALAQHHLEVEALAAERKKLMGEASRAKANIGRADLIEQLKQLRQQEQPPVQRRYVVNDSTVEALGVILNANPAGVLQFRDEITGFLCSMDRSGHENDRAFYLESWNGNSGYTYDRIGRGTMYIEAAVVSVLGAITPGPLGAYLRETFSGERDDGFIQRFQLAVYPDATATWRNVDRCADTKAKRTVFEIFERFVNFGGTPAEGEDISALRFDQAAQEFFDKWRAELEGRIRNPEEHAVLRAHLSKYRSLMPSLALIFYLADSDFGGVTIEPERLVVHEAPSTLRRCSGPQPGASTWRVTRGGFITASLRTPSCPPGCSQTS